MSTREKPNGVFLHVDALQLDLNIKKPRLSVAKIFNNNRILSEFRFDTVNLSIKRTEKFTAEATNLFLKENGHEILKAMQPQLQKKLSAEFTGISNTLLNNVPRNNFLLD